MVSQRANRERVGLLSFWGARDSRGRTRLIANVISTIGTCLGFAILWGVAWDISNRLLYYEFGRIAIDALMGALLLGSGIALLMIKAKSTAMIHLSSYVLFSLDFFGENILAVIQGRRPKSIEGYVAGAVLGALMLLFCYLSLRVVVALGTRRDPVRDIATTFD
jgi:hypothetical protein